MKATDIGNTGEDRAARFLTEHGFEIIERNWKTRFCEIDIVAQRKGVIYFVEVKTRSSAKYGVGVEYITSKKLRQMTFAAEFWVQAHKWEGMYQLSALGIDNYDIMWVEDVVQ